MKRIFFYFCILLLSKAVLFAQADIPKDSSIYKTLGWWKVRNESENITYITHRYMCGDNVLISNFILNNGGFAPKVFRESDGFEYTIYLKECLLYITKYQYSFDTYDSLVISKYIGDNCYSYADIKEFAPFTLYIKDFASSELKENCAHTIIEKNRMIETNRYFDNSKHDKFGIKKMIYTRLSKDEVKMEPVNNAQGIFFDAYSENLEFIKTRKELSEFYNNIKEGSFYYPCKEKLETLSYLVKKLEGKWEYKNVKSGVSMEFTVINQYDTYALFLPKTTLPRDVKLYPEVYLLFSKRGIMPWEKEVIAKPKVKVPYITLKFLFGRWGMRLLYSPSCMYLRESEDNYYNLDYHSPFTYINNNNNIYYFNGAAWDEAANKDNDYPEKIKAKRISLKWEVNEDFAKIDEYIDLKDGKGWQHTVSMEKIINK